MHIAYTYMRWAPGLHKCMLLPVQCLQSISFSKMPNTGKAYTRCIMHLLHHISWVDRHLLCISLIIGLQCSCLCSAYKAYSKKSAKTWPALTCESRYRAPVGTAFTMSVSKTLILPSKWSINASRYWGWQALFFLKGGKGGKKEEKKLRVVGFPLIVGP